jgi:hypothetical protein
MDHTTVNLLLVSRGVKRGWLIDARTRVSPSELQRLRLKVHPVQVSAAPHGNWAIVLREREAAPALQQTHKRIARLCGLPCGSALAWQDPAMPHAAIVQVMPLGGGQARRRSRVRDSPGAMIVTSFRCTSRWRIIRWMRAFHRRATAFELDTLVPHGLCFAFHIESPVLI